MLKAMNNLKPIIISGYYGFGNCGDEAILMAMIQEFSKFITRDKIIVLSKQPEKTKYLYKVNSINRLNLFSIINSLRHAGFLISGGGGLLQDVSGKGFSVLYYLSLIFLARLFKVPTVVYGQGIGPIIKIFNKKLIKWAFNNVNLITVRDEQSKIILKELDITSENITVNADTAFLIKKREITDKVKKKYGLEEHSSRVDNALRIGIIIRNCKNIANDYDKKIFEFASIADYLIEKKQADVFFIPFQPDTDISIIKDIVQRMKHSKAKIIEEELAPDEVLYLISKLSILIGMRLHSIIFATITAKPFIAIDYDPKVKNYVHSLNLPELLINVNQLTVKNIDNKLKYINVQRDIIESGLKIKAIQFEQEALSNVQSFNHLVEKKYLRKESENN